MKLLLLVPLIAVITVNGLSTENIHNRPQDYDSSDEYLQRNEMNLVDSNEDSTDDLEPLDMPGSKMLIFEDDKGHIEFELRNGLNKTGQPSGDCESNGGACKMNKQCNSTISIDYTCSKNGVCCIGEGKVRSASEIIIQVLSNAILLQGIAIQTLKEDQEKLFKTLQINQNSLMTNLSNGFSNVKNMLEIMENNIMSNLNRLVTCDALGGVKVGHQCLAFHDSNEGKLSWTAAAAACNSNGGWLAYVSDSMAVFEYATNLGKTDYWIGASDAHNEGIWMWLDGRPVGAQFLNNVTGGTNENCLVVDHANYHDHTCSNRYNYICEFDFEDQ